MKTIDNDKDTLDESLGILNLGDLEFQEDNEKDVKIDFEKCNLEFSNTTLFKFLDEDETRSNSCSKMYALKERNHARSKMLYHSITLIIFLVGRDRHRMKRI